MASVVYNSAKQAIGDGYIAFDSLSQTYRILLVNATYTPDVDTHIYVSSVVSAELSGTGYVRKDVVGRASTLDLANNWCNFVGDSITWTSINAGTACYAILYKFITNDADSMLIACIDFPDTVTNGGDFTIKPDGQTNGTYFRVA